MNVVHILDRKFGSICTHMERMRRNDVAQLCDSVLPLGNPAQLTTKTVPLTNK